MRSPTGGSAIKGKCMKKARNPIISPILTAFATLLLGMQISISAQTAQSEQPANGYVVEVMSCKCQPFTYLKIGQWIWYGSFDKVADWKPKQGELPLRAVKLYGYSTEGGLKVRVTALRGTTGHESEDPVADRSVSENKIAIDELKSIGVVPFEIRLVRAPQTVAQL